MYTEEALNASKMSYVKHFEDYNYKYHKHMYYAVVNNGIYFENDVWGLWNQTPKTLLYVR